MEARSGLGTRRSPPPSWGCGLADGAVDTFLRAYGSDWWGKKPRKKPPRAPAG
ncbi:hypothetical protein ABZ614_07750 [Streptomyces sp. NPDC013178]|uniref:hypothetical protein n=1 Tax=Streptomyces sp. NPDC013178 TaxID=3155118 RepID=UPI0033E595A9